MSMQYGAKEKKMQAIQDEKIMQMQIKHNSAVRGQSVFLCRHWFMFCFME